LREAADWFRQWPSQSFAEQNLRLMAEDRK
jgi:hypothetical protein